MKKFALTPEEILKLAPGRGYCFATDQITVEGRKVGFMYREGPDKPQDSGWRFFSGEETQDYVDNLDNLSLYDVNTIANYDPDILPYLDEPFGSAFERDSEHGRFRKVSTENDKSEY